MQETNPPSPTIRLTLVVGAILAVVGGLWLVVLATGSTDSVATADRAGTATVAAVDTPPAEDETPTDTASEPAEGAEAWTEFTLVALDQSDLGTGSSEFSAVALNEDTNRLMIAGDEGQLFEFNLSASGQPITPPRRTIKVEIGAGDVEGLAWVRGSTFAIANENDGRLLIVDIADDAMSVGPADLVQSIDTGIREEDGNGLEGVATWSAAEAPGFAVIDERPPQLQLLSSDGDVERVLPLDIGASDVSDLWAIDGGTFLVVSHEARQVVKLTINDDGTVDHQRVLDLTFDDGRFEQPEGIVASRDGARLYVVGEAPGPGRFSLGLWAIE